MKLAFGLSAALAVAVSIVAQNNAPVPPPATPLPWAYPLNPPPTPGAPPPAPVDNNAVHKLPGTTVELKMPQIRDGFNPPDWHPTSHPPMPEIVGKGRRPDVLACGYCHLPNGQGRPENAGIAGLPAAYIVQQMADYRNGHRKSSEPRMGPPARMLTIGKASNEAESKIAAEYFASLKFQPWIRVVEAKMVPKTHAAGGMLVVDEPHTMEPIGQRIIETPEDLERTELRDSKSGFIAYVPPGSIKKGEDLVMTGGKGKTVRCTTCHGADLKGSGPVPPLAGRSPSYVVRQLWDMQAGNRNGLWTPLMKEAVAKLTIDDLVNIAAYTASRMP